MNKKYCNNGFTLIELNVVICILGLVTLICIPNFKNTVENYRLKTSAEELGQNIRLAQKLAITEGVRYRVLIDFNTRTKYRLTAGIKTKSFDLPQGVYFDWTNFPKNTIEFHPSGAPTQGGTIAIKNNNTNLYVAVAVATGRVRISKTPPTR